MTGRQRIEQLALHLGAGEAGGFLFQLAAHQFFQLVEAFKAQRLGEVLVDRGFGFHLHLLHRDGELRVLALQVLGRVIGGEGDGDGLFIAGLDAFQLILEAGDELARTQHQCGILGLAAFEFHAVDAANEIDDQLVAGGGLLRLGRILVALLSARDPRQRFVQLGIGHRHHQLFQLQPVERGGGDFRQHFQFHRQFGILALGIAFGHFHLGLHRRAQRLFLHQPVDRFAHRIVQRIGMQRFAVHLAHQIGGHFAGAEAGHAHLRGDLLHLGIDARIDILCRDGDGVATLEAFIERFDDLHCQAFSNCACGGKTPR